MLSKLVALCIRARALMLVLLALLLGGGAIAAANLPVDALPDTSTIQVSVLTKAPGLSPIEVERAVTIPVELSMNGIPRGVEVRSTSRTGLSAVTMSIRRSAHIPSWTKPDTIQSASGLRRAHRDQRTCGMTQLHAITVQKTNAYGPVGRATRCVYISKRSPEYQADHISTA